MLFFNAFQQVNIYSFREVIKNFSNLLPISILSGYLLQTFG